MQNRILLARSQILLALTVACLPSWVAGQEPQIPADAEAGPEVRSAFRIDTGGVQNLDLPTGSVAAFRVPILLSGRSFTLSLERHEMRTEGFQLLIDDGQRLTRLPNGPTLTYRGTIEGLEKAVVSATLRYGQLWATIHTSAGVFGVQPIREHLPAAPRSSHVVYRKRDVTPADIRCGVHDTTPADLRRLGRPESNATHEAELAIDADYAFFVRHGSNTSSVTTAVMTILNATDVIFSRDVGIQYKLTGLIIRTAKVYSGTTTGTLLSEMRTRWNTYHTNIPRDLAHLFTGVGTFSGVVGTAYLSAVCTPAGYAVSKAYDGNHVRNVGLVAHELGHNWSATHCNANAPCYIMCSSIGGCDQSYSEFGAFAKARIIAHRDSRHCLQGVGPGTYTYYGNGCGRSSYGEPDLLGDEPTVGQTLKLILRKARPSSMARLCFGVSNSAWGSLPLPFHLINLNAKDCWIHAGCDFPVPLLTDAAGEAVVRVTIPNNPAFVGTVFFNQGWVFDPGANALGLALTVAARGRIGE